MAKKINKQKTKKPTITKRKIGSFYIGKLNSNSKNVYFVILVEADWKFMIALVSSFFFLDVLIKWEVN